MFDDLIYKIYYSTRELSYSKISSRLADFAELRFVSHNDVHKSISAYDRLKIVLIIDMF